MISGRDGYHNRGILLETQIFTTPRQRFVCNDSVSKQICASNTKCEYRSRLGRLRVPKKCFDIPHVEMLRTLLDVCMHHDGGMFTFVTINSKVSLKDLNFVERCASSVIANGSNASSSIFLALGVREPCYASFKGIHRLKLICHIHFRIEFV